MDGTLNVDNLYLGARGQLTLAATGQISVSSGLYLHAWTQTTVAQGAVIGTSSSLFSIPTIEIGFNATMTFAQTNVTIEATSFTMRSDSMLVTSGTGRKTTVKADSFTMEDGSVIDLNGGGSISGPGSGSGTQGASYGGEGAGNLNTAYGSAIDPVDFGSGTGSAAGGGIIEIIASGTAEVDGTLSVDGEQDGASGGSIYINAQTLKGHGNITANGGNSSDGGGSGGRIRIDVTSLTSFIGAITAYGGSGTSAGAAGTIYKTYEVSGGSQVRMVYVNNNGVVSTSTTLIKGVTDITDLQIEQHGQAMFDETGTTISVTKISGDFI